MKIVATTSLPAVDRPNADRWNAARSRQLLNIWVARQLSGYWYVRKNISEKVH